MNNSELTKKKLNIWYDNGIKGQFQDDINVLPSEVFDKWWLGKANQKIEKFNSCKKAEQDVAVLEYSDVIVYISDFDTIKQTGFFQEIIKLSRIDTQQKRILALKETKKKLLKQNNNDDYEASLEWMHQQLHKRKVTSLKQRDNTIITPVVESELKVTRKNKWWGKKIPITSGVMSALVVAGITINGFVDTINNNSEDFSSSPLIEESNIENEIIDDNFEIAMDINDIMPMPVFTDYESGVESYLSYEDESESLKALETKNRYGELIEKYAKKCGIDPKLVLGIATQESGDHELGLRTGSTGGLMQIEVSYWDGKEIEYYDFDDEQKYLLKISKDSIKNIENNLLIGCALLQNELRTYNYNILLATQSYNMGYSNISKILDQTSREIGVPKIQIINDHNCLEWLNNTDVPNEGDSNYVNNVLRYTGYGYHFYELTCKKPNGEYASITTGPIITKEPKVIA